MKNRVIQTFWTKPMFCNGSNLYQQMTMAYSSAKSIKQQGYYLVMYTDKIGAKMLNEFPYDEIIILDLDNINEKMFAAPKYFALKEESLGVIHLDYDIILEKPCLNINEDWDVLTQMIYNHPYLYEKERIYLNQNEIPKGMIDVQLSKYPYCTGVIGFNNEDIKNKFLDNYFDAVSIYRNKTIPKEICLDFVLEQSFTPTLVNKYGFKSAFVVKDGDFFKYTKDKSRYYIDKNTGFIHYQGKSKWSDEVQNIINNNLSKEAIKIINKNFLKIWTN